MNAREELADTLRTHVCEEGIDLINEGPDWHIHDAAKYAQEVASVVIAAGYRKPRTIHTAEELEALLTESVVRSRGGVVWEKYPDEDDLTFWMNPGSQRAASSRAISLPATVLFEPEVAS